MNNKNERCGTCNFFKEVTFGNDICNKFKDFTTKNSVPKQQKIIDGKLVTCYEQK